MKTKEEMKVYKREWARKKSGATAESLRNSETHKGRLGEELACKVLVGAYHYSKDNPQSFFDILWKNKTVDAKRANVFTRQERKERKVYNIKSKWWCFKSHASQVSMDYFFCVCCEQEEVTRIYLVPGREFGTAGITVGYHSSKFDKYRIWDKRSCMPLVNLAVGNLPE